MRPVAAPNGSRRRANACTPLAGASSEPLPPIRHFLSSPRCRSAYTYKIRIRPLPIPQTGATPIQESRTGDLNIGRNPLAPPAVSPTTQRSAIRGNFPPARAIFYWANGSYPRIRGTPMARWRPKKGVVVTSNPTSKSPPTPHRLAGGLFCGNFGAPSGIASPN